MGARPPSGLFALYSIGQELLSLDGFRPQRISICFNLLLAGLLLGSPPFDVLFDPAQHALDPVCPSFHLMILSVGRQGCRRRIATPRGLPPYHLSASLLTALGYSRWSSARVRPTSTNRSPGGRRARGRPAGSAPRG